MYIALFLITILYLYIVRKAGKPIVTYSIIAAFLVLLPVTNYCLGLLYQNFYTGEELYWLLPVFVLPAYTITELYQMNMQAWKKKVMLPIVAIVAILCGWMSFDKATVPAQSETVILQELDKEWIEVYEKILPHNPVMVAPKELMIHAREYSGEIRLPYGRDLWEVNLDYAFYDPYEEYLYDIALRVEENIPDKPLTLIDMLAKTQANVLVINKDNLSYSEDMQYPEKLKGSRTYFERFDETRHYVIYLKHEE